MNAYRGAASVPEFDLVVLPLGAALQAAQAAEVEAALIGLPPPEGWFVTPLGTEPIAVIVNAENPVRTYRVERLADLFSGRIQSWQNLGWRDLRVQPIIPLPGDELRTRFKGLILEESPFSPSALLAPSPAAVVELVSETPGAIGFLPYSQATQAVRTVRVEGALPGETDPNADGYPLEITLLATSPKEPQGAVREWLIWIQSESLTSPR